MFPYIFSIPTDELIRFLACLVFIYFLKKNLPTHTLWQTALLLVLPTLAAVEGGALYYNWANPALKSHSLSLMGSVGESYYGALAFQALIFWLLSTWIWKEKRDRAQAMDVFAIASCWVYSLLRIGCFAKGCCYGKLCRYPWAVIFKREDAFTPLLGFPLHPTQIYSAIHGALMGIFLYFLFKRGRLQGRQIWVFGILMGAGRIVTESFRADSKSSLWPGWLMNQWSSVGLMGFCAIALVVLTSCGLQMKHLICK